MRVRWLPSACTGYGSARRVTLRTCTVWGKRCEACPARPPADRFAYGAPHCMSQLHACPYYGVRKASAAAHIGDAEPPRGAALRVLTFPAVAVPYASLLHRATREALGIELAGNVVLIDEAHNLVEAINQARASATRALSYALTAALPCPAQLHSVTLSLAQLAQAEGELRRYFVKYERRFKESNARLIKQVLRCRPAPRLAVRQSPTCCVRRSSH
jgi:hypothetical protein